jgi:hypothetical protein
MKSGWLWRYSGQHTGPEGEVLDGREALRQLRAVLRQTRVAAVGLDAVQVDRPACEGNPTPMGQGMWTVHTTFLQVACAARCSRTAPRTVA